MIRPKAARELQMLFPETSLGNKAGIVEKDGPGLNFPKISLGPNWKSTRVWSGPNRSLKGDETASY